MAQTLIAQTNRGPVRGRRREGPAGQTFYSFQYIPYAKEPVGELSFKVSWRNVYVSLSKTIVSWCIVFDW